MVRKKADPSNELSDSNERETKLAFENLGFSARKLDKESKFIDGAPDFLFIRHEDKILCEVKTVNSAYNHKVYGPISMTMRPIKYPDQAIEIELQKCLAKIRPILDNSIKKRKAAIAYESSLANIPHLVAFFFDPLANDFLSLQFIITEFPEVSACINLVPDCEYRANLNSISQETLIELIDGEIPNPFPSEKKEKHWHFVLNPGAIIPIDPRIIGVCPFDQYFEEHPLP
jgi:hypothetical protein